VNQDATILTTGVASAATQCKIVTTTLTGTTPTSVTPICGYNQNANYYCPWQLGDAPLAPLLKALPIYYAAVNTQCNPQSIVCNAVYTGKIAGAQYIAQLSELLGAANISPYISNNADCVKKTISSMYFGLPGNAIVSSVSALALALLF
jgi:hypothetical protein